MPRYVVERACQLLNEQGKSIKNARILCVGAAYKPGSEDVRESAGIRVMSLLERRGAVVEYHDPLVSEVDVEGETKPSVVLDEQLINQCDLLILLIRQSFVDWQLIGKRAKQILDCCNAMKKRSSNIQRL